MNISPGIQIVNLALWLEQEKTLIINDLHLGYEESLRREGLLVPKSQMKETLQQLEKIWQKVQPKTVVINGDLKHAFGTVLNQEWKDVFTLFDFLLQHSSEIIIVKGNHDVIVGPIAEKKGIKVVDQYQINDILILHGDKPVETNAKTVIIGHEHPAITISEGSKREKYKCFLKGKWNNKELIVIPNFNPLSPGSDVLSEPRFGPFLEDSHNFETFVVSKGEVFRFGKVKDI